MAKAAIAEASQRQCRHEIPPLFTDFCARTLGVALTPGQRVLCLVAFDGLEPDRLEREDRELARDIFGDVDTIPPSARNVIAAMCGARGGKSYVLIALRLLHLALTVRLGSLAPGEEAVGVIVAPDLRLARQALRYAKGAAERSPAIAALIERKNVDQLGLRRRDGYLVTIECLPATRGGSAVRGRSLVAAALDEAAFFRDENHSVNDDEIFKAVAPRVLPGGQVVIASTPWAESGLLYRLYERNHGDPADALAVHAPTLLLRDDAHTRELVEREDERDPDNADREFRARPMAGGASEFFEPAAIDQCVDEALPMLVRPTAERQPATMGLDTGFRKDPSAGVAIRKRGDTYVVAECIEIKPPPGGMLKPSATIRQLVEVAERHRCGALACDQHYVETVREHADKLELVEAPGGMTGKVEMYTLVRRLMREGRVKIPAGNKRLIAQLRQVVGKPLAGGGLAISSPRRAGAHGDLASALVVGLWALETNAVDEGPMLRAIENMRRLGAG